MKPKGNSRLIILEGASGVGKTSIQFHLKELLRGRKYKVQSVPEFSKTPIGEILRNSKALQSPGYPKYLQNLGGALAYLADKAHLLEEVVNSEHDFIITDRYFISQFILGSLLIESKGTQHRLQKIILEAHRSLFKNFSDQSQIFILECEEAQIFQRLERREGKPLSKHIQNFVKDTARLYKEFNYEELQWKHSFINSGDNFDDIVNVIYSKIVKKDATALNDGNAGYE